MRVHKLILAEAIERLGLVGLVGLILLLAAVAYGMIGVRGAQGQLESTRSRADTAEARLQRIRSGAEKAPESPGQQLASFYGRLPSQGEATKSIDKIYDAAAKENISLDRGEYALVAEPSGRLARYQITLPVRGSYPTIRRFITGVQESVPNLSLDEISFQREAIGETELQVRIRMTLYLTRGTA